MPPAFTRHFLTLLRLMGNFYDLAFQLNGRGNYSSLWIEGILGTEMLNKWRVWRKPAQEESWGLLGEEPEMEGLAGGSCGAQGRLEGCWRGASGAGWPGRGTAGRGTTTEQPPSPSPAPAKGNPCSFFTGSSLPQPQGSHITQSQG